MTAPPAPLIAGICSAGAAARRRGLALRRSRSWRWCALSKRVYPCDSKRALRRSRSWRWRSSRGLALALLLALALAACGQPAQAHAGRRPWPGPFAAQPATPTPPAPLSLPRDEAPHGDLTEWWYYTGHLKAADGAEYGFESVVFQSRRGEFPPYYAAHVAVTDHQRASFQFDQRSGTAVSGAGPGFALRLDLWEWRGSAGRDHLEASLGSDYAFALDLTALKPPALHEGGYIDFGPAGGSYYYSRTRMALRGALEDHSVRKDVTGEAWFDHQWGNFLGSGAGGWDWFSAQLADGSDFTLSLLRGLNHEVVGAYGTYVRPDGATAHIDAADLRVEPLDSWTSPHSGVIYPSGWRVTIASQRLVLTFTPVIRDQELDTRDSTGTIYWEGEVRLAGTRDGSAIAGEGYVELTGYGTP